MHKEPVDMLAEKLITFLPLMTKKIIRFDITQSNRVLPVNQLMVLGILNEEGSLSISQICKKVFISKPQMTIIIDKLEKDGFVFRVHNEDDRRTININITEKGKGYCGNLLKVVKMNLKNKLVSLSPEDLSKLINSTETIESIFKQIE